METAKKSQQNNDTLVLLSYIGLLFASTGNMVGYMAKSPIIQGLSIVGTLVAFSCLGTSAISCIKEEAMSKPLKSIPKNEPRSF